MVVFVSLPYTEELTMVLLLIALLMCKGMSFGVYVSVCTCVY